MPSGKEHESYSEVGMREGPELLSNGTEVFGVDLIEREYIEEVLEDVRYIYLDRKKWKIG